MLFQCPFLKVNAHSGGQSWLYNAYQIREIRPAVEPGDSLPTYFSKSDLWLPGNSVMRKSVEINSSLEEESKTTKRTFHKR